MKLRIPVILCTLIPFLLIAEAPAESTQEILDHADSTTRSPGVSPIRRIERDFNKKYKKKREIIYRNIDGSLNNIRNPEMGKAHTPLIRITDQAYDDNISTMAGADRPNPRVVSNAVLAQDDQRVFAANKASDILWQWGQFLDHDIDLTEGTHPPENANIEIPIGDPFFDPQNNGGVILEFNRSIYVGGTGTDNPRQQLNEITAWIDASNVYGSDDERATALRRLDGSGKLKTSNGRLLPFNAYELPNAGGTGDNLFLAGDPRANEQIGLTAMHTLFVREHNRLADKIGRKYPWYSDEQIYQAARRIVAAQMQVITYNEFLPVLLGKNAIPKYQGYKPNVDASIANEFSTAAFRLGHSLLSPNIKRIYKKRKRFVVEDVPLREAFFRPDKIAPGNNIGSILRGLAYQQCQELDALVIDDVRNFLFGQPGSGGFDLASLNIQRGRDHGLMSYNETLIKLGMSPATSFADITSDPALQARLSTAYDGNVDQVDLWVGGLAEDDVPGAMVGPVFYHILRDQFIRLRDGDRFWYEKEFSGKELRNIKRTTLAKIIKRNTGVGGELQKNVFLVKK